MAVAEDEVHSIAVVVRSLRVDVVVLGNDADVVAGGSLDGRRLVEGQAKEVWTFASDPGVEPRVGLRIVGTDGGSTSLGSMVLNLSDTVVARIAPALPLANMWSLNSSTRDSPAPSLTDTPDDPRSRTGSEHRRYWLSFSVT
ncbi:hypothetical protein [Actinocorallia aurea]